MVDCRNALKSVCSLLVAGFLAAASPAGAQDSTLLGAGAGAGGGAMTGFALGGPVGAVVGGLLGAGVGAGAGHAIGKGDKMPKTSGTASGGNLIYDVQNELNAAGYNVGAPDGRYGPRTGNAIRAYQANNGLAQDGQASFALLDHLRAKRGGQPAPVQPPPAQPQPAGYVPPPPPPAQAQPQLPQPAGASNCKPYESRLIVDGKETVTKGTACLQPDGSWKPVN